MTIIEIILLILVIVLSIILIISLFLMNRKSKQPVIAGGQNESLIALDTKLEIIQKEYSEIQKTMSLSNQDSTKSLTTLSEKIETMDKFQKDLNKFNTEIKTNLDNLHNSTKNIPTISSELKGISDIYKHAKNRGNFGEFQLKVILEDIFGNNKEIVQEQVRLNDKSIVDFTIHIGNRVVPIDSKFPLDNYKKIIESEHDTDIKEFKQLFRRDIVNKFKEVSKYISPSQDIDNVIIFIPSEAMFGDINAWYGSEILLEANDNHVFICSPTTLTAMLKLFLVNEKDKALSKNIEFVKKQISKIFEDFNKVAKNWNAYIKTLFTLTNKAKELTNTNTQIVKKIGRIETDNKSLLEDIEHTIDESSNIKNQLSSEATSLREFDDETDE